MVTGTLILGWTVPLRWISESPI